MLQLLLEKLARGAKVKEHVMSEKLNSAIAVIGIDIGKNSFHLVGQDRRGSIVLRQKWFARPGRSAARQCAGVSERLATTPG